MQVEEPRPVWVRHDDDNWYPGWVEAQRREDDGWRGYVRFTVSPGLAHVLWFHESRIRPRDP